MRVPCREMMAALLLLVLAQADAPADEPVHPVTNQWTSGLWFARPGESFPLFPHPLAVKFDKHGIGVAYPMIRASEKTVFGGYAPDLVIETGAARPVVTAHGAAHVTVRLDDVLCTLARGVPVVWIEALKPVTLRLKPDRPERYLIVGNRTLAAGESLAVALMPDGGTLKPEDIPPAPRATTFAWKVDDTTIRAELTYTGSKDHPGLVAWRPHHWADREVDAIGTYRSVRGTLKLLKTSRIDMRHDIPPILAIPDMVNALRPEQRTTLAQRIDEDAPALLKDHVKRPVYDLGKRVFKLAQVAEIAHAAEHPMAARLADKLQADLHEVLGRAPGEEGAHFRPTGRPRGVVAVRDEHGNQAFNDHHFHYGYFLASAGTLLTLRPQTAGLVEPSLLALLGDVGNPEQGQDIPFCRGFDVYAGHSWASGYGRFGDGNNQESTSEALLRWYGLYRLGTAINDRKTVDLALTGLALERRAARFYWLGQRPDVNPFPDGYAKPMASLVWGGKSDFGTWFSGKPIHVYGIQFLPMSPAMTHVRDRRTFDRYTDYRPGTDDGRWDDIYHMAAAANGRKAPEKLKTYDSGNSASFYYLWTRYWEGRP